MFIGVEVYLSMGLTLEITQHPRPFLLTSNGTPMSNGRQIEYDEVVDEFYLCDLGSLNGTYMQMVRKAPAYEETQWSNGMG